MRTLQLLVFALLPGLVSAGSLAGSHALLPQIPQIADLPGEQDWSQALSLESFVEVSPNTGAQNGRRTVLRLLHDGRHLYVAIDAYDDQPARITTQQMRRDTFAIFSDDYVTLVLDTEGQGRNGFMFVVTPRGTQYDSLIYDGGQERPDWDAHWQSEATIDADGWHARLTIPLAAIGAGNRAASDKTSPDKTAPPWRINAERWMTHGSVQVRLSGIQPDKMVYSLADAITIAGVSATHDDWGLRLKPSVRASSVSAGASPDGKSHNDLDVGMELFHQAQSGLRTTAAFNTDFGEAEADDRIVNLTRFELFRQEKRAFFLEDAGRFSFGGLTESSATPYYSRRIGVDAQGYPQNLDLGLKLTGSYAGTDFGVFGARVAEGRSAPGKPVSSAADVGVARLTRSLDEQHRLGMIATTGNPAGTSGSYLWGLDYQYRNTQLQGNKTLEANLWTQESTNTGIGTGQAYGFNLDYPNDGLKASMAVQHIDESFSPALGFLAESGVDTGEGSVGWLSRNKQGDILNPGLDWEVRRRLDGTERSSVLNPEILLQNAAGDYLMPEVYLETDELATGYEILPDVFLPAGAYRWESLYLLAGTSMSRPVSAEIELQHGGFYDGDRSAVAMGVT